MPGKHTHQTHHICTAITGSTISIATAGLSDFLSIPVYGQPQNLGNILNELIHHKVFIPFSVYNQSLFEKLVPKFPHLTSTDFDIYLVYWSRDKLACNIKREDETAYIKFDPSSEITADDIGIINIQLTLSQLDNRISQLETQISQINFKSVLDLPSKSDQLRKLKQLKLQKSAFVKSLETSNKLWDELNTILIKINDSNLNHEVYQQLVSSSKILANLNSKVVWRT
ncbi:hypothetical protein Cantr_05676 [Candida viswanathii]|uniref:Uncharacterized protein n=1 Tax=Candida viswanathii TaxID=5486 RepID=A0A367XSA1_9ASCO|nr:hypothetical protein Cantr_05676 [Candida viswanathii]